MAMAMLIMMATAAHKGHTFAGTPKTTRKIIKQTSDSQHSFVISREENKAKKKMNIEKPIDQS